MMDMFLALVAVVFFTTVALIYSQAMWRQADNLNDATILVQSTQICHALLDEIDAKLFSKQLSFSNVISNYNYSTTTHFSHMQQDFDISVVASDCDSLGNDLSAPVANNIYKRVRVTVNTSGLSHPVSLRRLYTKTNLNI